MTAHGSASHQSPATPPQRTQQSGRPKSPARAWHRPRHQNCHRCPLLNSCKARALAHARHGRSPWDSSTLDNNSTSDPLPARPPLPQEPRADPDGPSPSPAGVRPGLTGGWAAPGGAGAPCHPGASSSPSHPLLLLLRNGAATLLLLLPRSFPLPSSFLFRFLSPLPLPARLHPAPGKTRPEMVSSSGVSLALTFRVLTKIYVNQG